MIPDNIIVQQVQDGDTDAFEILVDRYQKQVYNIAYRYTGSREDAFDLAQEAFLKAYRGIGNFRQEAAFKTWIYHITSNVCRDFLRKNKNKNETSIDAQVYTEEGEMQRQIADDNAGPEEIYERKEMMQAVQKVINSLPEDYREIIILREIQQLSYDDIAEILGCSLGTVKSRINRARGILKDRMDALKEQLQPQLRQNK